MNSEAEQRKGIANFLVLAERVLDVAYERAGIVLSPEVRAGRAVRIYFQYMADVTAKRDEPGFDLNRIKFEGDA